MSEFEQKLHDDNIRHFIVNKSINDKLVLAPINAMCRVLRTFIYQQVSKLTDTKLIKKSQIVQIINDFNTIYNKKFTVTREQIADQNKILKAHNQKLTDTFKIGDIVRVMLKHNALEKARKQKWSDGTYVIIDR